MFRASLCPSSGEQRPCVTACGVLHWFCWMWLVPVLGRCVAGCQHTVLGRKRRASHCRKEVALMKWRQRTVWHMTA